MKEYKSGTLQRPLSEQSRKAAITMPIPGKRNGQKAGKAKLQLTPPGLTNAPNSSTIPEPKMQVARPEATPRVGDWASPEQWREIGEFLLHQTIALIGATNPEDETSLMDTILGDYDEEEEGRGKNNISYQLRAMQDDADRVPELEDEVENLKERLERERKRNNILETTNQRLMEDRGNTEAEANFERLANYLASAIGCSRGRPVETLIGAVKDHLEILESRVKEDHRIKTLQSKTKTKSEKLKKLGEAKRNEEEAKVIDEVVFLVRRELKQTKTLVTKQASTKLTVTVEVGAQASLDVTDASSKPIEKVPDVERQRRNEGEKGKADVQRPPNEMPKDATVMAEVDGSPAYEDLSEYEKEIGDVWDPTPQSPKTKSTQGGEPRPPKHKKQAKAVIQEHTGNRAFVVHGIHCQRPLADITQDLRRAGIRGIMGTRWLVGEQRRKDKTTSSVVIFLDRTASFHAQDGQLWMKIRGCWHPIDEYDLNRGQRI